METEGNDEEESMETESYEPPKPSTSKAVQVTPKCDQNVKVDAQVHLKKPVQVATLQLLKCHWHFGLEEKEFQLRICQNFMMKMGWHIPVTICYHSLKSVLKGNYNL